MKLQKLHQLDPQMNATYPETYLKRGQCENYVLNQHQKPQMEKLLIELCGIFAKYRFDVDNESERTMKLTIDY